MSFTDYLDSEEELIRECKEIDRRSDGKRISWEEWEASIPLTETVSITDEEAEELNRMLEQTFPM